MSSPAVNLLKQGDDTFNSGKYAEAGEIYKQAVEAAEREASNASLVEALSMTARSYLIRGEGGQGRPWIERAARLAKPNEPKGWSRFLGVRGRFEWQDQKDNAKATATFKEMYDYCLQHKLYSRAIDAAHMVAITGGPEEQITWAYKGIEAAEASGDTGWLGPLWNNLGWVYNERKQYDKSLEALLKAREYHHKGKNELPKLIADIFVARAYRMVGNIDEAEKWTAKSHEWAKRLHAQDPENSDYNERLGNTHEELGDIAIARDRREEGLAHFRTARTLLIKAGVEKWGPEELKKLDARIAAVESAESRR